MRKSWSEERRVVSKIILSTIRKVWFVVCQNISMEVHISSFNVTRGEIS